MIKPDALHLFQCQFCGFAVTHYETESLNTDLPCPKCQDKFVSEFKAVKGKQEE